MKKFSLYFLLLTSVLLFSSCKKTTDDPTVTKPTFTIPKVLTGTAWSTEIDCMRTHDGFPIRLCLKFDSENDYTAYEGHGKSEDDHKWHWDTAEQDGEGSYE